MNASRSAIFALVLAASVAGTADAQQAGVQTHTQNGISYVTGGVGTGQQEAMKQLDSEGYNLRLVFAEQGTGAYLADVHVVVATLDGRPVLDTRVDGPALYAKVPGGKYRVTAEYRGKRQERTVTAGSAGPVALYWAPEGGTAPEPASSRAPHGDAPPLAGGHAGEGVTQGR